MADYILQLVWPITDATYSREELIKEARPQLDKLADQAHAVITGPPVWRIWPAASVPGWNAYAPGNVLVARAPADRYGPVHEFRLADPRPDQAVIRRLIDGNPPPKVRPIERTAAMAHMYDRGAEIGAVASRFGLTEKDARQGVLRGRDRLAISA